MKRISTILAIKLFLIISLTCLKGYSKGNVKNTVPGCTSLTHPLNNATDVPVETNLSWNAVEGAIGYMVFIRSSEEENIYGLYSAENTLTYDLPFNLPENTQIYVQIYPYNSDGEAVGCDEESFRTGSSVSLPTCTTLNHPLDNSTDISLNPVISWNEVTNASGYKIIIRDDFEFNREVILDNILTYKLPFNLPENTKIYLLVIPFNSNGDAINCTSETFITKGKALPLIVPKYFTPNNDGINDRWIVLNHLNNIICIYIYNQYGKLIANILDPQIGWNGTYKGSPVASSDYWYTIKFKNGGIQKGHFSLIR